MSGPRVLRVYHSAVVSEFRERDRLLRAEHGYDLELVVPPRWTEGGIRVEAEPDPEVPMHVVPTAGREHPILFWHRSRAFRQVLRRVRPDVLDLHEEPYGLAVAAALHATSAEGLRPAVCLYTAQNIHKRFPPPFRQLEQRALARADAVYPCSTEAAEVVRRKGFAGAVHVLPLGVSPRAGARTPAEGAPTIGFVGRLEPYKGGEVAVRAFAAATAGTDARLQVVGAGSQVEALREISKGLGILDRVDFTGAVSQSEALERIASYDVILVPSLTTPQWKEQFGRIPAQALEAGTPVIASASGSLEEVLGDCGVLVAEGDVEAFAGALRSLLDDPARRATLAAAGRRRAAEELSWSRVAEGFDRMYQQMLLGR